MWAGNVNECIGMLEVNMDSALLTQTQLLPLLLYIFSPLALGSYWGMIPTLLLIPLFVSRIHSEENVLTRDLPGYAAYRQKVRYRLLPGVW
jgi:protein-S-isoprenylcysteine O-methyltransferase Ste14